MHQCNKAAADEKNGNISTKVTKNEEKNKGTLLFSTLKVITILLIVEVAQCTMYIRQMKCKETHKRRYIS